MKATRRKGVACAAPSREIVELRVRLAEAEETLRAIRNGEVDVVVVTRKKRLQMFTLEGAGHAYRLLIESMNEGALTLAADKTILYANGCFAKMVRSPLEQVTGSSFCRFLAVEDQQKLQSLMRRVGQTGSKIQLLLHACDGSEVPVQISIRPLAKRGSGGATVGMVVTDITETRRNEERLRALTHRVVQVQEAERARVALELHDNITQLLCGVLFSSEALANKISARDRPAKREAVKLREMLGRAAGEVERLSRELRPSVLEHLGLAAVLRDTCRTFAERTGLKVKLACGEQAVVLPAEAELALYRILQTALANVEMHAHARHVAVSLGQTDDMVRLTIHDDGIGFAPDRASKREGAGGLDLLSMRERATYGGGTLAITSARRKGTKIEVSVPKAPKCAAAN